MLQLLAHPAAKQNENHRGDAQANSLTGTLPAWLKTERPRANAMFCQSRNPIDLAKGHRGNYVGAAVHARRKE